MFGTTISERACVALLLCISRATDDTLIFDVFEMGHLSI